MPVVADRTRAQLRLAIGHLLGAVREGTTSSAGAVGGTTLVDDSLRGSDDNHNGKWTVPNSGALAGVIRQVSDYVASTTTLTVAPAYASQVATSITYELWDEAYPPARIHELMNQAIMEVYGLAFDPVESLALKGNNKNARFDIPSGFSMLNRVDYRVSYDSKIIQNCDTAWDEATAPSGVTRAVDTEDKREGNAANKFTITAAVAANQVLSSKAITSLDISGYDYVEFWVKSSVTAAAGDLHLLLDDTALVASALETLALPALVANVWTSVRIALANPQSDTAIISLGLRYTTDLGACTIWIDDVRVVRNDSIVWKTLDPWHWRVDQETRDLVLDRSGVAFVGSALIKLVGGDEPTLLTAEGTVNEIDDEYLIYKTAGLALASAAGSDEVMMRRAGTFLGLAERQKDGMGPLVGVRLVE